MAIDLRLMRYVLAVADEGGFQRAAERLHMAQPPLSRQIRELERSLGVELFERRPTRLTEAGRVFAEGARRILAETEALTERTVQAARGTIGTVRIGYVTSAAYWAVPALLTAMGARHPGIRVETREMWAAELLPALDRGDLDAALARGIPDRPDLAREPLVREHLVAVVSSEHRLAGRGAVHLGELRGDRVRVIRRDVSPHYHDTLVAALHSTGERFEVVEEPVPGFRRPTLDERTFTVVPHVLGGHLPSGTVRLELRDPLPAVDLELVWRDPGAEPGTGPVGPVLARLIDTAGTLRA
ncbi:hypothetical protein ACZ90_58225 [Streptomyces albus subsp. albus]|nr:hypothetical protein ACZ90_58225 [Streptomyces albus subsp. albus]